MKKKFNVRDTSLAAYCEVLENLGERQSKVYAAIRQLKSCNNTMIAKHLNLPINQITPRVNELRKLSIVMQDKKDVCPLTGKMTLFWRVRKRL